MKKLAIFILSTALFLSAQAQSFQQMGNTLQRRIIGTDTTFRFNMGSPGFMYFPTTWWVQQNFAPIGSAGVTSFNGRTGAITPLVGDYSSFYPLLNGGGATGTWGINISGSAPLWNNVPIYTASEYSSGTISSMLLYNQTNSRVEFGGVSTIRNWLNINTGATLINSITGNSGTTTALQTGRTIGIITGDATSSGSSFDGTANNTNALTLATVNSNVGSFGNASNTATVTVNAKGLVTAASTTPIQIAESQVTNLTTDLATVSAGQKFYSATVKAATSTNTRNDASSTIELDNGNFVMAYTHFFDAPEDSDESAIYMATSTDRGQTWGASTELIPKISQGSFLPSFYKKTNGNILCVFFVQTSSSPRASSIYKIEFDQSFNVVSSATAIYTSGYQSPFSDRLVYDAINDRLLYPYCKLVSGDGSSTGSVYEGRMLVSSNEGTSWSDAGLSIGSDVTIYTGYGGATEPGIYYDPYKQKNVFYFRTLTGFVWASDLSYSAGTYSASASYQTSIVAANATSTIKYWPERKIFIASRNKVLNNAPLDYAGRKILDVLVSYDGVLFSPMYNLEQTVGDARVFEPNIYIDNTYNRILFSYSPSTSDGLWFNIKSAIVPGVFFGQQNDDPILNQNFYSQQANIKLSGNVDLTNPTDNGLITLRRSNNTGKYADIEFYDANGTLKGYYGLIQDGVQNMGTYAAEGIASTAVNGHAWGDNIPSGDDYNMGLRDGKLLLTATPQTSSYFFNAANYPNKATIEGGLTVTGKGIFGGTTDGITAMRYNTSGTGGALYSNNVTPTDINFALVTDGASTVLGGTTEAGLAVNGSNRLNAISTGVNVTGNLDATGNVTGSNLAISNWNTAYTNRITSLTTTGSSGASTLISNTLNIPTYTLAGLGGQAQLNGTGFVKATGTTISYDNSTYLPTSGFTTSAINALYGYTPANGANYALLSGGNSFSGNQSINGNLSVNDGTNGLVLRPHTSGSGRYAIYPNTVTPSNSNMSIYFDGASETFLNGASATGLLVGNTGIVVATSTGVSVTGTISATGGLANGTTATTQSANDNSTKVATTAYVDARSLSGTYTPTITNGTNVTTTTPTVCFYTRIGNIVTVTGAVGIITSSTSTNSALYISLPITSDLDTSSDLRGLGVASTTSSSDMNRIILIGDATNDRAEMTFYSGSTTSGSATFTFTYKVL